MRGFFVVAAIAGSWLAAARADARYFISATCTEGSYESTYAYVTYEQCSADVDALERGPDGVRCDFTCQIEGSDPEVAGDMAAQTITGVASVYRSPAIRSYDVRRKGWPYGRPAIEADMIPLGFGVAFGGGARFALGPSTVHLRILRKVSAGVFWGFLYPGDGGDVAGDRQLVGYGGDLRFALKSNHIDTFMKTNDHGAYWELYLETGFGRASIDGAHGNLYSAGLGIVVQTGWLFAFGVSTRVSYGQVDGAMDFETGQAYDAKIRSWDVVMAHVLVIGY